MASVATLLPVKKAVSNVVTRARFAKARPKINTLATKALKERKTPSSDNKTPEISPVEVSETIPVLSTDSNLVDVNQESLEIDKIQEVPPVEAVETIPVLNTDSNHVEVGQESLDIEKSDVVSAEHTNTESKIIQRPAIPKRRPAITVVPRIRFKKAKPIAPVRSNTIVDTVEEENPSATAVSNKNVECLPTSPIASKSLECPTISPVASKSLDYPSTSAVTNKSCEYPSLKSILQSPRKRIVTKKAYERRKRAANFSAKPNRSEMTMMDFIYWNPNTSPMKSNKPVTDGENIVPVENNEPPQVTEEPDENVNTGPKVIINEMEEIILDESSLVIQRKVDLNDKAIIEDDNTTYSSFRKKPNRSWSKKDTTKFYKALSLVGSDFALMEKLFQEDGKVTRTRRELKLKFKREERCNSKFIQAVIFSNGFQTFDLELLNDDNEDEINDEMLDNSEQVDDAPKRIKNIIQKVAMPAKRGRKKKIVTHDDENTLDSALWPKASNSKRERKAKTLPDFITEISDNDMNDYSDEEEEVLPCKKRNKLQVLSEESEDGNATKIQEEQHTSNNERVPTSQHSSSSQDTNTPVITKWVDTNEDQLPNVKIQTSRSGRKRKVKNMTDFIYDPDVLSDHSCESQPTEENIQPIPKDFCSTPVVENGNNLDIIGGSSALEVPEDICILDVNRVVENDDIQILNVSKKAIQHNSKDVFTDDSSQINENGIVVVTLENVIPSDNLTEVKVEYPNNSSFRNPEKHLQQREPKNCLKSSSSSSTIVENQSHNQGIASKNVEHLLQENLSTIYSASKDGSHNFFDLPGLKNYNNMSVSNLLTDARFQEVVTSDSPRKLRRKLIFPKDNLPIQKEPSYKPSFSNFTPMEEEDSTISSIPIKKELTEEPITVIETDLDSSVSAESLSSKIDSTLTPNRGQLDDVMLNQMSSTDQLMQTSIQEPLTVSQVAPAAVNIIPEHPSDSAPVVIFTRTHNDSQMLHLFLYNNSEQL